MSEQDDKLSYIDVMMDNLEAAQAGGASFAEATAVNAMIKAAWNEVATRQLLDLLVSKGGYDARGAGRT